MQFITQSFFQNPGFFFPPRPEDPPRVELRAHLATNMDDLRMADIATGVVNVLTDDLYVVDFGFGNSVQFVGELDYGAQGLLTGGVLTRLQETEGFAVKLDIQNIEAPALLIMDWLEAGATSTAFAFLFQGSDRFVGSAGDDLLRGYGGDDEMSGEYGADSLFGGDGNDTIDGGEDPGYLRGEDGDDLLVGGTFDDDMHGNRGDDILYGKGGADWVVGGQGEDRLFGESFDDIVLGNLGADTCGGGTGNDTLRGGQDNDLVLGGDGDDWLSGDRGFDVLTGGAGADTFFFFAGAGVERVTDFNAAEGDRVQLAPGSAYSVEQFGADVVIRIGAVDQVVLVGVQLSSLGEGSIFGA